MDRPNNKFQSPFYRPNADKMAAAPQTQLTFLPKNKSLKGIVAGRFNTHHVWVILEGYPRGYPIIVIPWMSLYLKKRDI